jgi:hypothetical protein
LYLRDLPAADQLVDQRVIFRELHHLPATHQVDAAVADVGDEPAVAGDQQGRRRGPHPALVGLGLSPVIDGVAGRLDRVLQDGQDVLGAHGGVALGEALDGGAVAVHRVAEFMHRDIRRHLARGVAPHPVSDNEERQLLVDQEVVFVRFALSSDVRRGPEAQLHRGGPSFVPDSEPQVATTNQAPLVAARVPIRQTI